MAVIWGSTDKSNWREKYCTPFPSHLWSPHALHICLFMWPISRFSTCCWKFFFFFFFLSREMSHVRDCRNLWKLTLSPFFWILYRKNRILVILCGNKEKLFARRLFSLIGNTAAFFLFYQLLDSLQKVSVRKNQGKTKSSLSTRK